MARALYYAAIAAMAWTLIAGVVVQCERVLIEHQPDNQRAARP